MLKIIFALIMLIHGLLHILGFAKAYGLSNLTQITRLNEIGMQMAQTVLYWRAILDSGVFKYRFYVLEKPNK